MNETKPGRLTELRDKFCAEYCPSANGDQRHLILEAMARAAALGITIAKECWEESDEFRELQELRELRNKYKF